MAVNWITAADLRTPADPYADEAAESASWILYKLSGERFPGVQKTTEWYGYETTECWYGCYFFSGQWTAYAQHAHNVVDASMPYAARQLRLRNTPVHSVESVTAREELLDPEMYRIANSAYLIRSDKTEWPIQGGIEVSYTYGTPAPSAGRAAAARLANELLLSYKDPDSCNLPERVTNVTRQGVSFTLLDPQEFLGQGRTGIYEIDLFLATANPSGARKRARVFSPDKPRGERYR